MISRRTNEGHDSFDPTPEPQIIVWIDATTLHNAARLIESRGHRFSEDSQILFDSILGRVAGSDAKVTDYILEELAKCPKCMRVVLEEKSIGPSGMLGHLRGKMPQNHAQSNRDDRLC